MPENPLDAVPCRPVARTLIEALMFDTWPSPAVITDYGIETQAHYAALQAAVKAGEDLAETLRQLDAVLGSGPKITAWVRGLVPGAPVFATSWDILAGLEEGV